MTDKKVKIGLAIMMCVIIVGGILFATTNNEKENEKKETPKTSESKKTIKSIIPEGLSLENEDLKIENGVLTFSVTLINNSDKKMEFKDVNVIVRDKNKNVVSDLKIAINNYLEKSEGMQLASQDMVNYSGETPDIIYVFNEK